jgi:hypothetical protein
VTSESQSIAATSSPVISLLFARSPFAVVGSVSKRIIYSLNGMRRRGLTPHIGEEIYVGMLPPITHSYTSSSVILIGFLIWIATSGNYSAPATIFWRMFSPLGISMRGRPQAHEFPLSTSTTRSLSACELLSSNRYDSATSTFALPYKITVGVASLTGDNFQSFKYQSMQHPLRYRHSVV